MLFTPLKLANVVFALSVSAVPNYGHRPKYDLSGCGKYQPIGWQNDTAKHTLQSGSYSRAYTAEVPADYNAHRHKQWPLILDFQGAGGDLERQRNNSGYSRYEDGRKYLVIYPAGVNKTWQGPDYAVEGVDDVQFVTDLLVHLRKNYCIDSTRVYVSGKSNGAGFANLLACSPNGDEIAVFGVASGALYGVTRDAPPCQYRRVLLESHGVKDETSIYYGDPVHGGGPPPNVTEWVDWWGERSCSKPDRRQTGDLGGYDITSYSCGRYNNPIQHFKVYEVGHCWPSSTGLNHESRRPDCGDRSLDYTPVLLANFRKWSLKNVPKSRWKGLGHSCLYLQP